MPSIKTCNRTPWEPVRFARTERLPRVPQSRRLLPGETLPPGQSISAGRDTLTMQGNGNLVLLAPGHTPIWSSHTSGSQGARLVMQPNGNLTVVGPGGQTLWSAGTYRQTYADIQLAAHGWSQGQARQFGCLDSIWLHESKWNELAGPQELLASPAWG